MQHIITTTSLQSKLHQKTHTNVTNTTFPPQNTHQCHQHNLLSTKHTPMSPTQPSLHKTHTNVTNTTFPPDRFINLSFPSPSWWLAGQLNLPLTKLKAPWRSLVPLLSFSPHSSLLSTHLLLGIMARVPAGSLVSA